MIPCTVILFNIFYTLKNAIMVKCFIMFDDIFAFANKIELKILYFRKLLRYNIIVLLVGWGLY